MSWEKTITKQGLSVLAGLDGDNVKIVYAWAGTGVYDSENLYERTSLVDPRQSLPIIEDAKIGNKRVLRLQVTSAQLEEGYPLNQLGVFISVNDSQPILYYLAQNKEADNIPSKYAAPGFVSEYIVTLVFTSGVDPDVAVPEIGYITPDALDARINSLKNELATGFSGIVFSDINTRPTGNWTLWLQDKGEIANYPFEPIEEISLVLETAPLDASGDFAVMYNDTDGETILNMTDDPVRAGKNDIIVEEQ